MTDKGEHLLNCPLPISEYDRVTMAHGGGGRLMHQLIDGLFLAAFGNSDLQQQHDGALIACDTGRLAFTTDSYVVHPLFFPGADIGSLAINGTVNDLAMCGARPRYLSAGFIIEEGFELADLWRVASSMRKAADEAGVRIVTGDTKVVDHGKGHGLFINTAGIGVIEHHLTISPVEVAEGDLVILSGDLGRHGIAVMAAREGLEFETEIESDCAPLWGAIAGLLEAGMEIHCLRDLTRGGLASALVEIADSAHVRIRLDDATIPVSEDVAAACEILGFDPIYVANEGRFVAFLPPEDAEKALSIMRSLPVSSDSRIIGEVNSAESPLVTLRTAHGTERIVDLLTGEQLPRIC